MKSTEKTAELKRLMVKHNWAIEDVAALLPINGKPRSHHTVYGWVTESQSQTVPEDCLVILALQIKLAKCQGKLKEAGSARPGLKVDKNRRR